MNSSDMNLAKKIQASILNLSDEQCNLNDVDLDQTEELSFNGFDNRE